MKRERGVFFIFFALLLSFCLTKVALSQTPSANPKHLPPPHVSDIVIPEHLGYIVESHQPATAAPTQLLIHIQEAHANLEAQEHIADIIQQLIERYGVRLILVEGGQGDVSLTSLHRYGPAPLRKEVAQRYFHDGVLTGEEYVNFTSDHELTLWGVEDEALYQQGLSVLLSAEPLSSTLKPVTASIRAAAERLKPSFYDAGLLALDQQTSAFDDGSLSLAKYAETLRNLAQRQQISLEAFPHLARYLLTKDLESSIDVANAQEEQQALVDRLSGRLSAEEFDQVKVKVQRLKDGEITQADFYEDLAHHADTVGLAPAPSSALSMYIRYLNTQSQIQVSSLGQELTDIAQQLRKRLPTSSEGRQLRQLLDQLDAAEKLFDIKLTPEELVLAQRLPGVTDSWRAFLEAHVPPAALPSEAFARLRMVEEALPKLLQFYEIALRRDEAIAANTLAKIRETGEPMTVLITGGFHGTRLTERLKDEGLSLVAVVPRISQPTDDRLYYALLKYKSGRGRLEDVEAIAGAKSL